ncbi:MAG: energy-coupling factor transporter ATPase [Ruminococcaceae bacterium]|nr:energy-coupling factor transporter ATPase [Oscillospiraceae bacterium]
MIKTEKVTYSYSEETEDIKFVLNGIDIEIKKGEFVAILGHNGCGKSTLAKLFNGLFLPAGGNVYVSGKNTKSTEEYWNIRQMVGMVFQNPDNQIVATVVEEDVAFAPENLGVPAEEIRRRVDDALKAVDMYEYRHHAPHLLSGGQKQRIAIAGAIAMRPECIVFDEPTAMLDPKGRKEVMAAIEKLREEGITIVLITHYMDEAVKADRVIVMDDGKIVMEDTPKNVFSQVKMLKGLGLDVPQVTELAYLLNKSGIPVKNDILTVDECTEEIMKFLQSDKGKAEN